MQYSLRSVKDTNYSDCTIKWSDLYFCLFSASPVICGGTAVLWEVWK